MCGQDRIDGNLALPCPQFGADRFIVRQHDQDRLRFVEALLDDGCQRADRAFKRVDPKKGPKPP